MGHDVGTCRFLQSNRDRREIYAIVDRGGSPAEVVDWVESTPLRGPEVGSTSWMRGGGRELDEVTRRLGLDRATLYRATHAEVADPGNLDAAGDPVFYPAFWDNWAIGDLSGRRSINPRSYRFKAWLSYHE